MEEETNPNPGQHVTATTTSVVDGSSSGPSSSYQAHEALEQNHPPLNRRRLWHRRSVLSYRHNESISPATGSEIRDDVWSCLILLVTFWFFASMTLILGFYGSSDLELGPNCSRLIQSSPVFVRSITVEELDEEKPGPVLYGFVEPPPMDVETTWTETHCTSVPTDFHREWTYYLNKGSRVDILYNVKSPSSAPLLLAIANGRESLVEWIEDPSYPNTTLSWNIIHGSGKIEQEILSSSSYYIAVGNLNSNAVEVELKFTIKSFMYNTTRAHYRCFLGHGACSLKISLLEAKMAVLTSPAHNKDSPADDDWYVRLSYGSQWFTYFIGSGLMTAVTLLAFRFCNRFRTTEEFQPGNMGSERAPLLSPKDDDTSSWGSSYDSVSNDEEDLQEWQVPENSLAGNATQDMENHSKSTTNNRRLCVICFDSPRDCFFLPCGHCAACFTCGTRIAEEAGSCPICRRKMKKVRKIFTV